MLSSSNRIILGLVCGHTALLLLFVFWRFVDADEGFYLSAAQQVAQGRLLYHDFFFPQMPFLPFLMSLVAGNGFITLYLSRLLGVIPAVLTLLLFVRMVTSLETDRRVAAMAIGIYACSGLMLAWHSPAKTYAWTDLFLLVSYWGVVKLGESRHQNWLVVSAIALAMAINFRLVLIAAIIPYSYSLWGLKRSIRFAPLMLSLCFIASISAPTLYLYFISPDHFLFNNLGFHLMRDPGLTFWLSIWQRTLTMAKLLVNPQIMIIVLLLIVALVKMRREGAFGADAGMRSVTPHVIAALFGLTIAFAYLVPSPVLQQYFVQAFPFFVIASIPTLKHLLSEHRVLRRWSNRSIVRILTAVYVLGLAPYLVLYLGAVRENDSPYRLESIRKLCAFAKNHPDSGPIFSEWVGVVPLSGRGSIPGLEFIGFDYPLPLTDSAKRAFHLPVNDDLSQALRDRIPALYVVWDAPDPHLLVVADSHYATVGVFDRFIVYARQQH